jgi:hypothetical protein
VFFESEDMMNSFTNLVNIEILCNKKCGNCNANVEIEFNDETSFETFKQPCGKHYKITIKECE